MTVKITINCNNAAFEDYPEMAVARLLRRMAKDAESGVARQSYRDLNGNTVAVLLIEDGGEENGL